MYVRGHKIPVVFWDIKKITFAFMGFLVTCKIQLKKAFSEHLKK
jgi:hypothetical protein